MIGLACFLTRALELAQQDLHLRLSLHIEAMSLGEQFVVFARVVIW